MRINCNIAYLGLFFYSLSILYALPLLCDPEPKLDNGTIELRVDLSAGGAISWLSKSGEARNIINNYDRGRQVQQSYYAGNPIDRRSEGQHPSWSPWPWNPIQAGDVYGNSPIVLNYSNNGDVIYVKTRPLLWDMNNEQAECDFETWVRLENNAVFVQNKLSVFRTDNIWEAIGRDQELPAVYTIGDLYKLYTYQGEYPFSQDELTEVIQYLTPGSSWAYWRGTEKWAAHVDQTNWGLGVYNADSDWFAGGYYGTHGGGVYDASTGYISPLGNVVMDKNTVFEYEYYLIVGSLSEIRSFVYDAEGHIYNSQEFQSMPWIQLLLFDE